MFEMDKYKVIAEKITYSLDGYIADHNNRNFGDADGWLRHVRNGWEEFIEAHPDSLNLHEHLQHQQAKVEELQKRLDGALKETQYALQYVEEDMRGNHEFLQMAMIRTLKAIEQVLKGGA